jgi:anti-sigma B factor antagonist
MMAVNAADRMTLSYRLDAGVKVVSITGEVDLYTSSELRESLLRVVTDENFGGLVVNLAEITFIDSTGIGVFVGVWHRVRATEAGMAFASPPQSVQVLLDTANLGKVLRVYDTEAQAVQEVQSWSAEQDA